MSSTSETGHAKIETNFFALKTICAGYDLAYNPSNPSILLTALNTRHAAAKATIDEVKAQKVPFGNAENARELAFEPLKRTATRVMGALKASGATAAIIADAETINRKIQGKKSPSTPPPPPPHPGDPIPDPVSVSQQSYDMKLDHLKKLIQLLTAETAYQPNEVPLKVVTLITLAETLETANQAVITAWVPFSNAMIARNTALYAPQTGLIEIANTVKNYVKSVFGSTSPQFLQIRGIEFKYPTSYY